MNSQPIDPTEEMMVKIRQEATTLISKINPQLLDEIHQVISRCPGAVAAATLSGVLADVLCFLSKTEDGLGKNVLIASEAILRIATAGLHKKGKAQTLITH